MACVGNLSSWGWRQEDGEFEVILIISYTVDLSHLNYGRSCLKTPKANSLNQELLPLTNKKASHP